MVYFDTVKVTAVHTERIPDKANEALQCGNEVKPSLQPLRILSYFK